MKVNLEISSFCQGQCIPCSHKNMKRKKGFMDIILLDKILVELPLNVEEIYPTLFGEPLIDKNLEKKLQVIRNRNAAKIILYTNGFLLNPQTNSFLYKYLNKIVISFHVWEGNFELDDLIKKIHQFKDDAPPRLEIQVTLLDIGDMEDKKALFRKLFPKEGIIFPARNWDTFQTGLNNSKVPCGRVYSLNVLWDGTVVPCCRAYEGIPSLGDLNKQTVSEVWNSEKYVDLRKQFSLGQKPMEICKNCYPT